MSEEGEQKAEQELQLLHHHDNLAVVWPTGLYAEVGEILVTIGDTLSFSTEILCTNPHRAVVLCSRMRFVVKLSMVTQCHRA